jgi:hypothetical protein
MRKLWSLLFPLILAAGCASKDGKEQPKTYINRIKHFETGDLKVLYSQSEPGIIPEAYAKVNFPDTLIADLRLQAQTLKSLRRFEQSLLPVAKAQLVKLQESEKQLRRHFAAELKQAEELNKLIGEMNKVKQKIGGFEHELK